MGGSNWRRAQRGRGLEELGEKGPEPQSLRLGFGPSLFRAPQVLAPVSGGPRVDPEPRVYSGGESPFSQVRPPALRKDLGVCPRRPRT